jgi:DNA polymerase-3 subunit delta'
LFELEKKYESLPWLSETRQQLAGLAAAGRCPHALLLQGRAGTGRRQLALWLTESLLGADPSRPSSAEEGAPEAGHPDFVALEFEFKKNSKEKKTTIGIDQVRELIKFLALTSHGRAGRVAVVYPADAMTLQAANSLLKTLEEPPADAVIVLISESLARLPATVVSRCQRVRVPVPPAAQALDWLAEQASGAELGPLLEFAGGAPLAALELHEADFAAEASQFAADIRDLEESRKNPVVIAARWKKQPDLALRWLYWRLSRRVREGLGIPPDTAIEAPAGAEYEPGTVHACFDQMSRIRELRRVINGGINAELNIAGLLMDWYGGFGRL